MLDGTEQLRREHSNPTPASGERISVVTPTFQRPAELLELLDNLAAQNLLPSEVIIVDGSTGDESELAVERKKQQTTYPFVLKYIRHGGGTAEQRNRGIDVAKGDYIALIDDDVRLERDFLSEIVRVFNDDSAHEIGGIAGYRTNRHFTLESRSRWRWYRRLGLLKSFEAGRYDFESGYPINNNMQPPFSGIRPVDFMTTACAVWRRSVFGSGLRFDPFFKDYGVLEDAHFSLRAGKRWKLVQCGDARCIELHSPNGRVSRQSLGYKCVVNYYYVYNDIAGPLQPVRKFRFWRFQAFELCRIGLSAIRRRSLADASDVIGRLKGIFAVMRGNQLNDR
jgi:glycosyltransferase involved in cell wall biosynthesis